MTKLKKIGILSLAKFQATLAGLMGVICGIMYSFGGLLIDTLVTFDLLSATQMGTPGLSYGTFLAFGALIAMPAIGFGIGFVVGIIEAILYNLFARRFGGVKIDFEG